MTRETAYQSSNQEVKRRRLERLLGELQDLDSRRRRLWRFVRFERQRETRLADRQNRAPRSTPQEEEVVGDIRQTELAIDRTVAEIGDLVFDLGLVGVNLW